MQQTQTQNFHNPRLSTSSHSSISAATNALLNGLLPSHRFSQISTNASTLTANLTPNQLKELQQRNNKLKRLKLLKQTSISLCLTILLTFVLLITIELGSTLVKIQSKSHLLKISNFNSTNNITAENQYPIQAFFTCIWIFNGLLFLNYFIIHFIAIQRRSRRVQTITVFLREFGSIFDNQKTPSNNTLIDFLLKICLLCFLWYLSCYLLFRSMTILLPIEIIILYSMTITLRQILGWIFLHEQFLGNKIIAYILAFSALLCLAHNDGFRFNKFLLGLAMVALAVGLKTTFEVLINGFVKDLNSTKLRIVMINVCLFGTCILWPFVLLLSFTQIEELEFKHIQWLSTIVTLICALTYNILTIVISFKYSSIANVACLLFVIPLISLIDRYILKIKYSPLVVSAIICSFAGVLLSMIPKEWYQASEKNKMKQAFGLLNKDSNANTNTTGVGGTTTTTTTTGTSSAFEEIRAQRRIRNALLYNEVKT